MNKFIGVGRLTRDPEQNSLSSGSKVTKFGIAMDHRFKNKTTGETENRACFVDCTAWNGTGDFVTRWFKKGDGIVLEGRLIYETWETEDGQKRSKHSIMVENVEFAPGKRGGDQGGNDTANAANAGGEEPAKDGSLPF